MKRLHRMPFGAEVGDDGSVEFRLWAPAAKDVLLQLHRNGHVQQMSPQADGEGWYSLHTDQAQRGDLYSYLINDEQVVPDPASRFQPQGVHGPSQVVDPTIAEWRDTIWRGRPWEQAVVYELHTGTFSDSGTYEGIERRLDYLADLGVNALELMPLSAFPGERNWGYDGVLPFAPSQCYGSPDDLKRLVQAAHEREMMVLLDVVYNHFGPDGNYLHLYAPNFFTHKHQTPWGDGINFDGPYSEIVREFFIHNALYWLEEYHFDGLRLDAVHAIQDDSSPDFLSELAERVQQGPGRDRLIHLILENDDNAAHYLDLGANNNRSMYTAQWNDDIHHSLHTLVTGEGDGYYGDYAGSGARHLARCLAEGFAYQGEPSPYRDNRLRGESSAHLPPTAFVSFLQNHDQVGNRALGERIDTIAEANALTAALAVRLLAPSPPLLFMGEEFAATTPFLFFCDFHGELGEAVTKGRRSEFAQFASFSGTEGESQIPDPNELKTFTDSKLDWHSLNEVRHQERLQLCKDLLALRQEAVVPGLMGTDPINASYETIGPTAISVKWQLRDGSHLAMLINLGSEPCPFSAELCPEAASLIYCQPDALAVALFSELASEVTLPPWSVAVFLDGARAHSDSRHSTINALQARVTSRFGPSQTGESAVSLNTDLEALTHIPDATYRLQLHRGFNFPDASQIVPYLHQLGISHCYCSPYLKARPGSTHGYNITDHTRLNPEIGTQAQFNQFVRTLHTHNMGHILDTVPNHMGIMGRDNKWWLDVLENGPASPYSQFFDIDWTPLRPEMHNKVLVPVLGDHYGNILDSGELRLSFDSENGAFAVEYYEHLFPIDPQTYPYIFKDSEQCITEPRQSEDDVLLEFQSLLTAFENLPSRSSTDPQELLERNRDKELLKQRLAALYGEHQAVAKIVSASTDHHNSAEPHTPEDPGRLHLLLERQAYRLAHWRVASDDINYRRFFDINELACLRMEDPEVFEQTHNTTLDFLARNKVQGLRIDHPDGLYNPAEYFQRLQERGAQLTQSAWTQKPLYLLAEKILSRDEPLRHDWALHGTTGYEFAALCTGLFIDSRHADDMQDIYDQFIGRRTDLDDVIYHCKKLIMKTSLASEVAVLANQLNRISEADPHTRDFTLNGLRQAIIETVACFPVYRTYITDDSASEEDKRYIDQAIDNAIRRSQAVDVSSLAFIRDLLHNIGKNKNRRLQERIRRFVMQLQQYCAPVMAKGVEDTAFYVYHRLVALNEVGADPGKFGVTPDEFHQANQERLKHWPHSMLALSTHDSKRSADVRARIGVLSEIPHRWKAAVLHWQDLNREHKTLRDNRLWPESNIEYLLYQTLIGAWPLEPLDTLDLDSLRERIQAYLLKAAREAKQHTSWINSNLDYEQDLKDFVDKVLNWNNRDFLQDLADFQHPISEAGAIVSLSQQLLALTSPGVPDIYQGDELWNFSLVDPDNRRPVDYTKRIETLHLMHQTRSAEQEDTDWMEALTKPIDTGNAKCYLIWKCLDFRRQHRELFLCGEYRPLSVTGDRAEHIVSFARTYQGHTAIVVVPRLLAGAIGLAGLSSGTQEKMEFWGNTEVALPMPHNGTESFDHTNVLTGDKLDIKNNRSTLKLPISTLFSRFPVALIHQYGAR